MTLCIICDEKHQSIQSLYRHLCFSHRLATMRLPWAATLAVPGEEFGTSRDAICLACGKVLGKIKSSTHDLTVRHWTIAFGVFERLIVSHLIDVRRESQFALDSHMIAFIMVGKNEMSVV